ncbi:bacteriophage Mu Gp45 protein [Agrobacterium vitis]|nr:bacteriophage Mu Gp45 protein [Agrobacterium vitis]
MNLFRRGVLSGIDVSGGQHLANLKGFYNEELVNVPRIKEFGFSSSPPAGATALIMALNGRADNAMVMGLDHGSHGPRDLGAGHTAIYDAYGNVVSLVQNKVRIVTAGAIELVSASLTHNGVNIGATHVHGGIVKGGSDTAVPH